MINLIVVMLLVKVTTYFLVAWGTQRIFTGAYRLRYSNPNNKVRRNCHRIVTTAIMHNGIEHSIIFVTETQVRHQRLLVSPLPIILGIELFAIELAFKAAHTLSFSIPPENSPLDLMNLQIHVSMRGSFSTSLCMKSSYHQISNEAQLKNNINQYQDVHTATNI